MGFCVLQGKCIRRQREQKCVETCARVRIVCLGTRWRFIYVHQRFTGGACAVVVAAAIARTTGVLMGQCITVTPRRRRRLPPTF